MGMIYKRGRVYWIKYYRDGRPYRESARSHKMADARRLLRKREGEIAEGQLPGIFFDRVRFSELTGDILNDYIINKKSSWCNVERIIRLHLKPFFEGRRATDITTSLVREYISHRLGVGAANATINRELSALKRMFSLAGQSTPPKVSQVPFIPMLRENNTRKGFLEHEQFLALRKALPENLRGLVTFGYKTGWRISEIINLTWDRIDLDQGIVRLEAGETKNNAARTIYLDGELKEILRDQFIRRQLGCAYVFHRNGKRVKSIRKAWNTACWQMGLGEKIFHDLRRTAIRNMVRAGIPERVAMMISGHKTRSVFDRYNIVSTNDLKMAAEKLSAYLSATGTSMGTINQSAGS